MMGVNADESLSFLSFLLTKPLTNHIYEAAIHLLFGDMAGQVLDTYPSEVSFFLISCVISFGWRKIHYFWLIIWEERPLLKVTLVNISSLFVSVYRIWILSISWSVGQERRAWHNLLKVDNRDNIAKIEQDAIFDCPSRRLMRNLTSSFKYHFDAHAMSSYAHWSDGLELVLDDDLLFFAWRKVWKPESKFQFGYIDLGCTLWVVFCQECNWQM